MTERHREIPRSKVANAKVRALRTRPMFAIACYDRGLLKSIYEIQKNNKTVDNENFHQSRSCKLYNFSLFFNRYYHLYLGPSVHLFSSGGVGIGARVVKGIFVWTNLHPF